MATKKPGGKRKTAGASAVREPTGAPAEPERKDRVLQARVPDSLYRDLVGQARRLRVPVSNLVRNILADSIRMVENVIDGGLDIAEALGPRVVDADLRAAIGWQRMTLGRRTVCARCGAALAKGAEAFASIGAPRGRTIILCGECQCRL